MAHRELIIRNLEYCEFSLSLFFFGHRFIKDFAIDPGSIPGLGRSPREGNNSP